MHIAVKFEVKLGNIKRKSAPEKTFTTKLSGSVQIFKILMIVEQSSGFPKN